MPRLQKSSAREIPGGTSHPENESSVGNSCHGLFQAKEELSHNFFFIFTFKEFLKYYVTLNIFAYVFFNVGTVVNGTLNGTWYIVVVYFRLRKLVR